MFVMQTSPDCEYVEKLEENKSVLVMDFIGLARSRYSCKKFDSRQISKEQLDSILEAGC